MRFPKLPGHSAFKDPWAMTVLVGFVAAYHFDNPHVIPAVKDAFLAAVDDYQIQTEMAKVFSGATEDHAGFISSELSEEYPIYRHVRNMVSASSDANFEMCGASEWPARWFGEPDENTFNMEGDGRAVVTYTHYESEYTGQEYGFVQFWSDDCESLDVNMNGMPLLSH